MRSRKISQDTHAVDWNKKARPSRKAQQMRWAGDKPRQCEHGQEGHRPGHKQSGLGEWLVVVFGDGKRQKSKTAHKFLPWDTTPGASRENHQEVDLFKCLFFSHLFN